MLCKCQQVRKFPINPVGITNLPAPDLRFCSVFGFSHHIKQDALQPPAYIRMVRIMKQVLELAWVHGQVVKFPIPLAL